MSPTASRRPSTTIGSGLSARGSSHRKFDDTLGSGRRPAPARAPRQAAGRSGAANFDSGSEHSATLPLGQPQPELKIAFSRILAVDDAFLRGRPDFRPLSSFADDAPIAALDRHANRIRRRVEYGVFAGPKAVKPCLDPDIDRIGVFVGDRERRRGRRLRRSPQHSERDRSPTIDPVLWSRRTLIHPGAVGASRRREPRARIAGGRRGKEKYGNRMERNSQQ